MSYLIGLDVGTSGVKAILINPRGRVVASAFGEYPMATPKPLWAEQNPEAWWRAAMSTLRRIVKIAGGSTKIAGLGLTGQMHGLVLLDSRGKVLRPCIMWNDQRTAEECSEITSMVGEDRLLAMTGNPVLPGFTAPKILWVRKHEPAVYGNTSHVLLPKDYVRYRLTGEYASEMSDASGTSLLDVRNRRWSNEILQALRIPAEWLPSLVESPGLTGGVSRVAAQATGLREGTPVVGGGGDQAAGGVGSGTVAEGTISVTIGTSGVVFAHSNTYRVEQKGRLHAFCHSVPGAWHLMGVTLSAGGSLRWVRDTLCAEEILLAKKRRVDPYEIMMASAARSPAGSEGLLFLPYLSGERTPYPDPHARAAFIGLTVRHGKSHMIRSVLEGVAFSLRDCLELMKAMDIQADDVRVSGGGARSKLWCRILADVLGTRLSTVTSTEGAPYGAALLAGVGVGIFGSVTEACSRTVRVASSTEPGRDRVLYDELYQIYRQSYPQNQPIFHSLSNLSNK
ncbi:MAG: xylulokinase [Ignavibacteriales bacterium]|nr:xylulokinase [Ignavibacteriales bacterium]